MQEIIDKIIERLEEETEYQYTKGDEADNKCTFEEITIGNARRKMGECYGHAIEIVKEVVKEYNGGWIPCSERLPTPYEKVQVTFVSAITGENTTTNNFAYVNNYGAWRWEDKAATNVPIIAWRENLKTPYKSNVEVSNE